MTRIEMEARRLAAVEDLRAGKRPAHVAKAHGVSRTSVHRWQSKLRAGVSLALRTSPGRPRRLTPGQDLLVTALYVAGPAAFVRDRLELERILPGRTPVWSFRDWHLDRWHEREFAEAIELTLGVRFHPDHVGRMMHARGWSPRKVEGGRVVSPVSASLPPSCL